MKKTLIKFSSVIFAMLMLIAVSTALFAPVGTASADDTDTVTVDVIKAPVSNLEGNETATGSALKLIFESISETRAIIIPESYFVEYEGPDFADYHKVSYAGENFYFNGEPSVTKIIVASGEQLTPNVTLTLKDGAEVSINRRPITSEFVIKFLAYCDNGTEIYVSATSENTSVKGFIPLDSVNPFIVPYQSRTQTEREELLASKAEQPPIIEDGHFTANTSVALRIIIIIGIAIPAILIVILLFKPSKNERRYAKNSVRSTRGRDEFDYDDSRSYRRRDERDDRDRDYDRDRYDDRYDRRDDRDYDRRGRGNDSRYYDDRDYDDR